MIQVPSLPGLYYEQVPARGLPSPLRSDVAGFIGRTRRGPCDRIIRVEGWREYQNHFGGLDPNSPFTYSIRGYFENGGEVAHIVRIIGRESIVAQGQWKISENSGDAPAQIHTSLPLPNRSGLTNEIQATIQASNPGAWADRATVLITYMKHGPRHWPSLEFVVHVHAEEVERFSIDVTDNSHPENKTGLAEQVAQQSRFIRLQTRQAIEIHKLIAANDTLRVFHWPKVILNVTTTLPKKTASCFQQYKAALDLLKDQSEVAIVAFPGLFDDLVNGDPKNRPANAATSYQQIAAIAIADAQHLQDRLILVDPVPMNSDVGESSATTISVTADEAIQFAGRLRQVDASSQFLRAVAIYYPHLRVQDPLNPIQHPLRLVPASGHVAGVMSRIDRERGAHHTPANTLLADAIDLGSSIDATVGGQLNNLGINLIRCLPGRGLSVWGGRTLDLSDAGRFIAHRRFVHRLVRAVRRVAEPIVFDNNVPETWMMLIRAVSSVLLEAFRSGGLKGERPEEAFRIRCDEQTNPMTQRVQGRVLCEIDVALSVPMEFITLRISVSQSGRLEVFDA